MRDEESLLRGYKKKIKNTGKRFQEKSRFFFLKIKEILYPLAHEGHVG